MLTSYFSMTTQPFCEKTPDMLLQKESRMNEGIARLKYFLQQGPLAMITGQTGVGKSTLVRLFTNFASSTYSCAYIHSTQISSTGLLKLISAAFGLNPPLYKDRVLSQLQDKFRNDDSLSLLIIDEAHLLDVESLTELRLLVSSILDDSKLRILLVGQESLKLKLKQPQLIDLKDRIQIRYQLRPFNKDQTISYINFQLNSSGSSERIFDNDVKNSIHDFAQGVCRQINNISTACLIQAAFANKQKIDRILFNTTVSEFQTF